MKKISYCLLFLLIFSQEQKLPGVSNIEELINVKAKKIVWQKIKT